nr:MAG TPA: Sine oculis-binding protein [Caudoviricetes sp.]
MATPPKGRAGERCDPCKHVRHSVSRGVIDSNGYVIAYSVAIIKTLWQKLVLV